MTRDQDFVNAIRDAFKRLAIKFPERSIIAIGLYSIDDEPTFTIAANVDHLKLTLISVLGLLESQDAPVLSIINDNDPKKS